MAADATRDSRLTVLACTFEDNEAGRIGGGALEYFPTTDGILAMTNCTLSSNSATTGSGVLCRRGAQVTMDNSIIAHGITGEAIACADGASAALTCCDVWDNEGGDWVGCIENQFPGNDNFHEDPLFCGLENPPYPYTLDYASPLVSSSGSCGQIGAWWAGCGGVCEVRAYGASQPTWALAPPQPNPFTRETKFTLDLPPGAGLSIDVYDSSGRHVRVLARAARVGGSRVVFWDGRDDRGLLQRSGIYFIRVRANGASKERSVLLLR